MSARPEPATLPGVVCARSILSTALLLLAMPGPAAFAAVSPQDTLLVEHPYDLTPTLDSVRVASAVPALAAAIVERGRIVAVGCAGVTLAGGVRPARAGDAFHLGSCTKAMTATMIATLIDRGTLAPDLTIERAFPELVPTMNPAYRGVTLANLLSHRGGIPPYTDLSDDALDRLLQLPGSPGEQRRAFVARVLAQPPVHDTTESFDYSNAGYTIAAVMAERASGESWEALMKQHLFEPLHMTSADFGWPVAPGHARGVRGHRCESDSMRTRVTPAPIDDWYRIGAVLAPGGDVRCSVIDLARFAAYHLTRAEPASEHPLLAPATWEWLHASPDSVPLGYAMGWQLVASDSGEVVLFHDGTAGTFYARVAIFPRRGRAIALVANAGGPCGKDACVVGLGAAARAWRRARR